MGQEITKGRKQQHWRNQYLWTMFITNFPPHTDSQDLRIICGRLGTVADVYLPRKLSKSGKRFAFVRFLLRRMQEEDDASELARKLSGIWIGSYHLFATVARREKKPFYQSQKQGRNFNNNRLMKTCCWKMKQDDRISALPDCLLLEILYRLPSTKEAIRTGTLSKRWEHLWTWLPTLDFSQINYFYTQDFVSFVNKTLTQCCQPKLKKFELSIPGYDTRYKSQVNNWIRYAIRCNVEKLYVYVYLYSYYKDYPKFLVELCVDQSFFICSCFTHLRLAGCNLNSVGPISWKNLKSLSISNGRFDQDLIGNILSGSPLLETLALICCYGYSRLNITSKILKKLIICGCPRRITINAPNILSLTIQDYHRLYKPFLVDVSSLVQANLHYTRRESYTDEEEEEEEENLKDFILHFSNVKELKITGFEYAATQVACRLEAKGFVFPSNMKIVKSSYWLWYTNFLKARKAIKLNV